MNKTKVERLLKSINEVINEDIPTNAEYIVLLANMLRVFAIAGIEKDNRLAALDINEIGEDYGEQLRTPLVDTPASGVYGL